MDPYHDKPDHPAMCIYCGTIIQHDNTDFMCTRCIQELKKRQKKTPFDGVSVANEIKNEYLAFRDTLEGIK